MTSEKLQYWDSIAKVFKGNGSNRLWRSHSDAVNIDLVKRWLPPGMLDKILKTDLFDEAIDFGLYPLLKGRAREFIGMDISNLIINMSLENIDGIHVINSDIRSLPFIKSSIDLIVSISTLDHFSKKRDIVNSLREIKRVLRRGGQLILTLDNLYNPIIALRAILPFRFMNRLGIVPYYVGATLSPPQLCRTITRLGFDVTEVTTVMHCPRVFAVLTAGILDKYAGIEIRRKFLGMLMAFEHLVDLPTRLLTGNFIAIRAVNR